MKNIFRNEALICGNICTVQTSTAVLGCFILFHIFMVTVKWFVGSKMVWIHAPSTIEQ